MKPKLLTTAQFIESLKRKATQFRIKALATDDLEERKKHEREASAMQHEARNLEKAYGQTIHTADRKG